MEKGYKPAQEEDGEKRIITNLMTYMGQDLQP